MRTAVSYLLRRCLVIPLMPVFAVLFALTVLVALPLSAVICPLLAVLRGGVPRWRVLRLTTVACIYCLGETVCVLACLLLWVASGFGWRLRAPWSVHAHRVILGDFLGAVLGVCHVAFGFRVHLTEPQAHPADVLRASEPRPLIVLARHAGPGASFALIHELIRRYGREVTVVLKAQLRVDPAIDLLLSRTGCAWIPGTSSSDRGMTAVACVGEAAAKLHGRGALVLFPEGADWTPTRQVQAVRRLWTKGKRREARAAARMPHVLPPRPAGTLAALHNAPRADVLIFTHTGHDQLLDMASSWAAIPLRVPLTMTWWRADAAEVPSGDEQDVLQWLQSTWTDIDAWIDEQQQLQVATTGG